MKNVFVPYKQSADLKELGFDEPSWCYFMNDIFNSSMFLKDYSYFNLMSQKNIEYVIAPLYQQAFRWFREKYRLEIIFKPDSFNHENKKLREYVIISYDKTWKLEEILEPSHWIRKGCFKTYEEAELECLKKLIEIVKSKKS